MGKGSQRGLPGGGDTQVASLRMRCQVEEEGSTNQAQRKNFPPNSKASFRRHLPGPHHSQHQSCPQRGSKKRPQSLHSGGRLALRAHVEVPDARPLPIPSSALPQERPACPSSVRFPPGPGVPRLVWARMQRRLDVVGCGVHSGLWTPVWAPDGGWGLSAWGSPGS